MSSKTKTVIQIETHKITVIRRQDGNNDRVSGEIEQARDGDSQRGKPEPAIGPLESGETDQGNLYSGGIRK